MIFNCEPLIRVLLLFQRNISVGPVFMTWPVFQSLLVDNIWILLLLRKIFWKFPVLMLIYLILDHLYGCFSCFRWLYQSVQDSTYNLSFKITIFRDLFSRSNMKRSIFLLWLEKTWVSCPKIVEYTVKISEHPWKAVSVTFETETIGPCLV